MVDDILNSELLNGWQNKPALSNPQPYVPNMQIEPQDNTRIYPATPIELAH